MAKKLLSRFVCQECGSSFPKWSGRCSSCQAWNSLVEEAATGGRPTTGRRLEALAIKQISGLKSNQRLGSGMPEFDQVVGGGIVPGSLLLVAGEPGIGKSTLILQIAAGAAVSSRVLYVSGEESLHQLKLRAERLGVKSLKLELAASTSADDVMATILSGDYQLVIVDSIQTMATDNVSTAAGTISQVTASAQALQAAAKAAHVAVIVVGHVTKEGSIAGPKLLEHIVDVVLYLEGERFGNFKILRGAKNRFGSTYEVGIFAMSAAGMEPVKNPSAALLSERVEGDGSVVLATMEGTRPLLVEVQALVSPSPYGYPKRTVVGFDLNRLNLLLAVLNKRAGLHLGAHDVYVNIVGGLKVMEPAADLAVALAIASAQRGRPITDKTVAFGEVGLSGEVRSVNQAERRLSEAKRLGFIRAIAPGPPKAFIKPVKTISQAIKLALGDK